MPNPTELAQASTAAVLEHTEAYFRDMTEALVVGGKVLDHAVSLHQLNVDLEGEENPDNSAIYPAAVQLAEVARQSLGMLHSLKQAGYIRMAEGDDPFELVAPTSLALNAGEAAPTDSSDGNADDNTDSKPAARPHPGESKPGGEVAEVDLRTRQRQEALLVKIFGTKHEDEIQDISQAGMVIFGKLLGRTYAGLKELHPRAVNGQAERAKQFEEYLAGRDLEEMASEYNVGPAAFYILLRKAIEIMNREITADQMDKLFDAALAAGQPRTTEA